MWPPGQQFHDANVHRGSLKPFHPNTGCSTSEAEVGSTPNHQKMTCPTFEAGGLGTLYVAVSFCTVTCVPQKMIG